MRWNSFCGDLLRDFTSIQKRTPINRRLSQARDLSLQQRNHGIFTGVVPRVTPATGDSPVKQQLSLGVIKEDITRSFCAKEFRLHSVNILKQRDTWYVRNAFPKAASAPIR